HGSDDHANSLVGALYIANHEAHKPRMRQGAIGADGRITWHDDERREHSRIRIVRIIEQEDLKQRGFL
ncbi:MAG: hypothetical protein ACXW6T_24855, partial [Candidatus Binatia bacterium]